MGPDDFLYIAWTLDVYAILVWLEQTPDSSSSNNASNYIHRPRTMVLLQIQGRIQ